MRFLGVLCSTTIVAIIATAAPSLAAVIVLPDASVNYDFGAGFGPISYTDCTNANGSFCHISANASYAHGDMMMTASATSAWPIAGRTFSGNGTFFFEVLGPVGASTSIPIDILANATTSALGRDSGAYVEINIPHLFDVDACSGNPTSVASDACTEQSPRWPTTLGPSYPATIPLDSKLPITFYWTLEDYENASISIDPQIVIDPSFLANNPGFSLIFSPDVIGGVPEPATWALFILGFGGIGAMMRRQRTLGSTMGAAT